MIAVVTGAGSGIGLACVAKLLVRDYVVIAFVNNKVGEERLLANLALNNVRVHMLYIVIADFENANQVNEAIAELKHIINENGKKLDVFINSAGIYSSLNFKAKSGNKIYMIVKFLTPVKLLNEFSNFLNSGKNSRFLFLFPNLSRNVNC